MFTRRQFTSLVFGSAIGAAVHAQEANARPRLAVSSWSFHNYFPNTRYGQPAFEVAEWTLDEMIRRAKRALDIDAFEISSAHLASQENAELDRFRAFAREQNVRLIHLSDNVRGLNMAVTDENRRNEAVATFERLIGIAQRLGIPTMRVNTGTPDANVNWDIATTIDCYRRLARYARQRDVEIIIENHFGISADPRNVTRIIEAVGENISSCPDFGLFRNNDDRWAGLPEMFRNCRRVVSAKFHGLSEQNEHRDYDLERCYRILREARFAGWVSLEYEGNQEPTAQLQRMAPLARRWIAG